MGSEPFRIDPHHPAFAGHFPERPILPGVVLLEEAARRIAAALGLKRAVAWQVNRVKLLRPALPGDALLLQWDEPTVKGDIGFRIERDGETLVEGSLRTAES